MAAASYEEKGTWGYLVVVLGSSGTYLAVVLGRASGIPLTEVGYVAPMLWAIGISIALSTAGGVVVETARPSETMKNDIRDKDINRFGGYIGSMVLAVAMAVPYGLALAKAGSFWIAHSIYPAFVLPAIAGTVVRLVAYHRGQIQNGRSVLHGRMGVVSDAFSSA